MKNNFLKNHSSVFVYAVLGLILILATCLRIYKIGQVPASPDWDEASLGYNAYSILLTGRDEYGKFLPVVLRSFDDYKPAMYAYLIIPFIKIFGLSIVSVRLPSIIFGVLGIGTIFYIVKELFSKGLKFGSIFISANMLALLTSLLIAISPWHLQFSRVGFEANVGLTLNLLVVLFFLKAFKNKYFLILAVLFAALNIYVYQSEKVYTPLLLVLLCVAFFKQLIKIPKFIIVISLIFGVLVTIPMLVFILFNPNALSRAKGVSVFFDTTKLLTSNQKKVNFDIQRKDLLGLALDNRRVEYVKAFVAGYFSHFEPNWLFYRGDVARHHAPFMGNLYLFTFPFILVGFYVLLFSDVNKKTKYFVVLFILIAPIPAAVTIDVPHAVRTINIIPAYDLLTSLGILTVRSYLLGKKRYVTFPIFGLITLAIFLNLSYYFNQYYAQLNYFDSQYWQYGWEDAVSYTAKEAKKFDYVVVSNQLPLDQSYIFFLYYLKYDPFQYQQEGRTQSEGFNKTYKSFGKYTFREIHWERDKYLKNTLFLGRPEDFSDNIGKTIHYLNGEPAIVSPNK